jgi:hypothetical protein
MSYRTPLAAACPERGAAAFDQIPAAIQRRDDLTSGAKRLYGLLMSVQRMRAQPDYRWLARELAASVRSIVRWVQQLVAAGLIAVRRRGQGLANLFVVLALVTSGDAAAQSAGASGSQRRPDDSFNKNKRERSRSTGHKPNDDRCPRCPHTSHGTTCSRCGCRTYDSGEAVLTRYGPLRV